MLCQSVEGQIDNSSISRFSVRCKHKAYDINDVLSQFPYNNSRFWHCESPSVKLGDLNYVDGAL